MEKEIKQITYNFLDIINDKQCAKSLYEQAYGHYSSKIADETYFESLSHDCNHLKLSKKYKKNNIAVFPIQYDRENDEFDKYKNFVINEFLTPIVSKMMNIIFSYGFSANFYNTFKFKYFIPILEAEYSRMAKEDLDYNSEKPFIICIESAISSFLNDVEYTNSISDKVLNKLKNSLKNFKFVPVLMSDSGENIICDPIKLLDCFCVSYKLSSKDNNKITCNEQILVNVSDTKVNLTKDYKINLRESNFALRHILNYILRLCFIEIIRKHSTIDVSASVSDDVIENIKNELFIYNSRTAKVIKDYLIKFKSNYSHFFSLQTKESICKLITDMFTYITVNEKYLYCNDKLGKYQMKDPVSTSVTATTKLYSMISAIESMNRDYMKSNSFIVDANALHSTFDLISKNMRDIVELRNEFFNLIYMNPDIFLDKWYPNDKSFESYKKTDNFFNHCIPDAIMYEKAGSAYKNFVLSHLVNELRCIYFKGANIDDNMSMDDILNYDKENGFEPSKYTNIIDQLFTIIEKLSLAIKNVSCLYFEKILQDIQHWSAIMENNVSHYQFFDTTNEFTKYNNDSIVGREDFDFFTFDLFMKKIRFI